MKIIDLHCDTLWQLTADPKAGLRKNNYCVDLEKLKEAHSLAQFFAFYIDLNEVEDPLAACLKMADRFYGELEKNQDILGLARNYNELLQNSHDGKISALLTVEEGGVLKGDMENLSLLYNKGVRLITLSWNYPNEIGYPNHKWQYQQEGLTDFGNDVVAEMNRLGMIIDVSHLSDQGFYDVAALSNKPFVASHSNARAVWRHSRNLTDEMIKMLADKGGIIGINFERSFLGDKEISTVHDMLRHLQHIITIGGIDCAAIGTDFDGIEPKVEIANIGQMEKLVKGMEQAGLSTTEIEKVCSQNALRVIKDVL
jgi:membrane dipeptidase